MFLRNVGSYKVHTLGSVCKILCRTICDSFCRYVWFKSDFFTSGNVKSSSSSSSLDRVKYLLDSVRTDSVATCSPIQWASGLKRSERESDHPTSATVEVNETRMYISTPALRLHGVMLS
jgi:hypothetical protein